MSTNDNSNNNLAVAIHQALATPEGAIPPPTAVPTGKAKVAVSFLTQATDPVLLVAGQHVLTGMTGNAAYPTPMPALADITAAFNAYKAAVNAARDSRPQLAVRNQRRTAFTGLLRNLAHYVQIVSGGDLPTLQSSGFPVQRGRRQPVGPLPAPANLRVRRGSNSGQLAVRCDRLKQAGAYEWRYASAATPTAWVEIESTLAASVVIDGLVPGTVYIVQARVLGTAGTSDWSDSASLMVV